MLSILIRLKTQTLVNINFNKILIFKLKRKQKLKQVFFEDKNTSLKNILTEKQQKHVVWINQLFERIFSFFLISVKHSVKFVELIYLR